MAQPGYALFLALLIVAPLLKPGYLLLRDAVSHRGRIYRIPPGIDFGAAGDATGFRRGDGVFLIDGGIVVKSLLVWGCGWRDGARPIGGRSSPVAGAGGQFVGITVAIWNPYVAERLCRAIGACASATAVCPGWRRRC